MHAPESIIATVAAVTGVPVAAITGKRRTRRIAYARFLAIAHIHLHHDWWPLEEISKYFGHRDHDTITRSIRRHGELCASHASYSEHSRQVREDLAAELLTPLTFHCR